LHFLHLAPVEMSGILNRGEESRVGVAVGHDIEPEAVAAVLGDAVFVGREHDIARVRPDSLHLDEPQLTGVDIKTGDIVPEILRGHIEDLAAE